MSDKAFKCDEYKMQLEPTKKSESHMKRTLPRISGGGIEDGPHCKLIL